MGQHSEKELKMVVNADRMCISILKPEITRKQSKNS